MNTPTNVLTIWTDAVAEICEAAAEYLANSSVLSAECEPAQSRLEQALSQFTDHTHILPRDYRGMEGRIRELEADHAELSKETEELHARFSRINDLLRATGDFAVGAAPDPLDAQVKEQLAELEAVKPRKRGAK